jgi:hypothetical protein
MSNDPKNQSGSDSAASGESKKYDEPGKAVDPKRAHEGESEPNEQREENTEQEEIEG